MFADKIRSRVAREFFFILNAMTDHYRALTRMEDTESVRVGYILTLLAVYMIREETKGKFTRRHIVRETQLPRSSVYRIINEFVEEGILTETNGEFECNTHTPDFLINPENVYGRELDSVAPDEDDIREDLKREFQILQTRLLDHISTEFSRIRVAPITPGIHNEPFKDDSVYTPKKPKDVLDEIDDPGELDDSIESQIGDDLFL